MLSKGDSLKVSFGSIVARTHGTKEPGQNSEAQGILSIYSLPTGFVTIGCTGTTRIGYSAEQTDRSGGNCSILFMCRAHVSSPAPSTCTSAILPL